MALSEPKRQRTSTYEVLGENVKQNPSNEVSPIDGSQQKIEDNSKQLNLLVQKVSNKRRTRTIAVDSPAAALPSTVPSGTRRALPSTKEHLVHRNSRSASEPNLLCDKALARVTPTTEPPSEITDISKPKVSKAQSTTHQKSLDVTATPSSTQKSLAGVRLSVNTPKSSMKATKSAKIVKPIFTVGRNDASPAKKKGFQHNGSGIPRFVSYARRLKVPNFARIHERAFNRMEALDDYVDKKRKRTDTFGSATKKPGVAPEEVFQPTVTSTRNVNFSFISTRSPSNKTPSYSKSKAVQVEGSKSRESLTSLASAQKLTKKSPKVAETPQSIVKETSKSSSRFCNTIRNTPKTVKKFTDITHRSSQPTEEFPEQKSFKGSIKKVATCSRRSPRTCLAMASAKLSPSGHPSALPRLLKENVKPVNLSLIIPALSKQDASQKQEVSDSVPKRLEYNPKTDNNITTSYVPHKVAVKPLTNRSTLKNMAQRKPKIKSRQEIREGQKKILKGVRFNRRFELQMANRGITL